MEIMKELKEVGNNDYRAWLSKKCQQNGGHDFVLRYGEGGMQIPFYECSICSFRMSNTAMKEALKSNQAEKAHEYLLYFGMNGEEKRFYQCAICGQVATEAEVTGRAC